MTHHLVLLNGSAPGYSIRLEPSMAAVTIGRHISRDLPLDDHRASRLHARVFNRPDGWHVEDCESLNGTIVNSQPIKQTILQAGDLIRIGEQLILFALNAEENGSGSDIQPNMMKATTLAGRLLSSDRRGEIVEQSVSDSMTRAVRDSTVLCRYVTQLQEQSEGEELLRVAISSLSEGIGADSVSMWLIRGDGRLKASRSWGRPLGTERDSHLLASLAVEKNKALLIQRPGDVSPAPPASDSTAKLGTALAVPIPGTQLCRGAIECHRRPGNKPFVRSDLDFAVVVAHQLGLALENVEHRERLEHANVELRRRLASQSKLAGSSESMQKVMSQIARVGPTISTVLILGESGTGKELAAQSIHELSPRHAGPYIAVNCAAFSESLLESELFGHEAGAFTGADRRHIGQFERSHRGTIFLDEIGEMSLACQAKLLRLLEGQPFLRVGGQEPINVEVRIIAATHRDLPAWVKEGRFREDLYYRLRVIDICMPPLRDRGDDVIELANEFLSHFGRQTGRVNCRLSASAVARIQHYPWPGNVRELRNAIERSVVLGQTDEITSADLGLPEPTADAPPELQLESLREAEHRHIRFVLQQVGGNKTQACRILNIGRGTLYNKLENQE